MSQGANAAPKEPQSATERTLTPASDQTVKQVPVEVKKAVVFFIGGAADKESYYFQGPNNNVADAQILLDAHFQLERQSGTYESHHLGYSDVRGSWDIDSDVKSKIASKAMPVYLIGHSLGGWNGAHLAEILTDDGYNVEVLGMV
ncbi:alpha/beta hydrolase [Metapseudomonas otitidis]|uniref:alpha/beta hydrolase n=1 Tax=Metapseudomonas otitidis TaxID=319939 RepID=UPI0013F65E64|nr:alpha/beta hydrolase [Pseudomonas otitidis]